MFIVEFHDKRTLARVSRKSIARRRASKEYSTYHSRVNSNVGSHGFLSSKSFRLRLCRMNKCKTERSLVSPVKEELAGKVSDVFRPCPALRTWRQHGSAQQLLMPRILIPQLPTPPFLQSLIREDTRNFKTLKIPRSLSKFIGRPTVDARPRHGRTQLGDPAR